MQTLLIICHNRISYAGSHPSTQHARHQHKPTTSCTMKATFYQQPTSNVTPKSFKTPFLSHAFTKIRHASLYLLLEHLKIHPCKMDGLHASHFLKVANHTSLSYLSLFQNLILPLQCSFIFVFGTHLLFSFFFISFGVPAEKEEDHPFVALTHSLSFGKWMVSNGSHAPLFFLLFPTAGLNVF